MLKKTTALLSLCFPLLVIGCSSKQASLYPTTASIASKPSYSVTSQSLQQRAKNFLQRPIPADMQYVPNSLSEQFIREYAETATVKLDEQSRQLLIEMATSFPLVENAPPNTEADYMNENTLILRKILAEVTQK